MNKDKDIYDKYFFDRASEMEAPSAIAVVEILIRHFSPESVIDIGCGQGMYLKEFQKKGVKILGYNNSGVALTESMVGDKIKLHDLRLSLALERKFSLCLCFEVAEHLPLESSESLVETLIGLSDIIIFTAATPGQGSLEIGHINEQPHEFWIEKFQKKGFKLDKKLTEEIREEMQKKEVIWWISKNLMIFKNK